ncbi:homeobox-leucine zipper protein HOX12-like [Salvia hispanica]|uniref:homeobox-leucine zipper protein HOX12-like n=1 Tax=Salvia hispanica TaxID=49212 RepID=UPI002009419A|nr:homeobox-leucine zipper protein HOX12-like [Salvia hispanica]
MLGRKTGFLGHLQLMLDTMIDSLKLAFEESEHLTKVRKMDLVRVTGLDMEQVTSWFNRKRARKRAKLSILKLERINAELKQLLQQRHEREIRLVKELEERKRREAELQDENLRLKCRIAAIIPQFDPTVDFSHAYHS